MRQNYLGASALIQTESKPVRETGNLLQAERKAWGTFCININRPGLTARDHMHLIKQHFTAARWFISQRIQQLTH